MIRQRKNRKSTTTKHATPTPKPTEPTDQKTKKSKNLKKNLSGAYAKAMTDSLSKAKERRMRTFRTELVCLNEIKTMIESYEAHQNETSSPIFQDMAGKILIMIRNIIVQKRMALDILWDNERNTG